MRRKRVIVGLVALATVGAVVAFWPRGPKPCRETFEQVRVGMARDKVIATVGSLPRPYYDGTDRARFFDFPYWDAWDGGDCALLVWYDQNDHVSWRAIHDIPPDKRPFFGRLRDRLRP
jgi:hypothetical protein